MTDQVFVNNIIQNITIDEKQKEKNEIKLIETNETKINKIEIDKSKKIKIKKKRCNLDGCRKRLGLLNYDCRCGNMYCDKHTSSSSHKCTFDYKEDHLNKLQKNNISVKFNKIEKI
jgi:predicted nucleic acid binding AN1-type Zn finger protein